VAESTVRRYVGRRKQEIGLAKREIFVPQSYAWGREAQVDWYEATAEIGGERVVLQVFSLRSMASGGAFHRAYLHATQQAFLEAHELAFRYWGGVFHQLRYDNLGLAVKKILRGYQREETERFLAFRSHWGFQGQFCNPGAAQEKGGVEGEVGYFRRNHWVPVPQAKDLGELNEQRLAACQQDEQRVLAGRSESVGAAMRVEQSHLLPLPGEGFDLVEVSFPLVDSAGCVRLRTNFYSVPAKAGSRVQAKLYSSYVEAWLEGRCVARHERSYGRQQQVLDLEHYLEVLEKKPGAMAGSKPLAQWREMGRWPASYDRFWEELRQRHGLGEGTRQMISLLKLGRAHGWKELQASVEKAAGSNCWDVAAVKYLLATGEGDRPHPEAVELGWLERYERPLPVMNEYDQLLSPGVGR
jgi:hypothetical protein